MEVLSHRPVYIEKKVEPIFRSPANGLKALKSVLCLFHNVALDVGISGLLHVLGHPFGAM